MQLLNVPFGKTVLSQKVKAVETTFENMVVKLLDNPVVVDIARAEYQKLSKDEKFSYKNGKYFTPCSMFDEVRSLPNCNKIQVICLDIDDPDQARELDEFTIDAALGTFNYAVYSTLSSTPKNPRLRIIVEASIRLDSAYYAACIRSIGELLGLSKITSESLVPCQPMFVPTVCSDDGGNYTKFWSFSGRPFSLEDCDEVQPELFNEGERPADDDALVYMVPPIDISIDTVQAALEHISPDCNMHEWKEIACAIKHQFQNDEDAGFLLFDQWSSGAVERVYEGTESNLRMWNTFKANPAHRDPTTIKTLLRKAIDNGWDNSATESDLEDISEQIQNAEDLTEINDLMKKVSSISMDRYAKALIVNEFKVACKRLHIGYTVPDIKDACRYKLDKSGIYEAEDGMILHDSIKVPKWAENFIFISNIGTTGVYFDTRTGAEYSPTAFNTTFSRFMMTEEDIIKRAPRPKVLPAEYLQNQCGITQVYDKSYSPSDGLYFIDDGKKLFNIYQAPKLIEVSEDQVTDAGNILTDHLVWLLNDNREYANMLISFMAHMVQHPEHRIKWALVLVGRQGCGKSTIFGILGGLLGLSNVTKITRSGVEEKYTPWAGFKQLVCMEEMRISGKNRKFLMDKLKPYISDEVVSTRNMYSSEKIVKNVSNLILFSNHDDALPLEQGDRRYYVLKSLRTRKEIMGRLDEGMFAPIQRYNFESADFSIESASAMHEFLRTFKISEKFSYQGHAPETDYRQEMIEDSMCGLQVAIKELISEGEAGVTDKVVSSTSLTAQLPFYIQQNGIEARVSNREVANTLRMLEFEKIFGGTRVRINGRKHTVWVKSDHKEELLKDNKYLDILGESLGDDDF
ncbi:MAG: putative primase [Prokaryotic dsDNA virus sp.]|nr:hypothetical protein [Cytophagaceae bacterium]QDP54335.1 MAG: putative primase [Prokaryotic dsDNA virus sp.]|tara:strand:- start:1950 stop:4520 length:2571 start_codon:yes stop_codon:yes gene_type:complete